MRVIVRLMAAAAAIMILLAGVCPTATFAQDSGQAANIPWSGYWWPFYEGALTTGANYYGHPAPVEKYEELTQGRYPSTTSAWYNQNYYDPSAPTWYGLCANWAEAAVMENYPILPSVKNNIVFRVGDKKGLLTLAHTNDLVVRGDGTQPAIFHYWLLHYIGEQKTAFVADLDPGPEVWSYPIYAYQMQQTTTGNTISVRVTISYANDFVSPDFMGTQTQQNVYTYDLTTDAAGNITGGTWTGNSVDDHPQQLTFPLSVQPVGGGLDYQTVRQLAMSQDDELENGSKPVLIGPGTYNLILMDQDQYQINAQVGDTFRLGVQKQPGSAQDMHLVLYDATGSVLYDTMVSTSAPFNVTLIAEHPPYTVSLTQSDYTDPNIYTLQLDQRSQFHQNVPYVPTNGSWSGFALTNPSDTPVTGVTLSTYGTSGQPIQTLVGPLTLAPREKRTFFFADLPWRLQDKTMTTGMNLNADAPVAFVNLIGQSKNQLAAMVQNGSYGPRIILPDTKAAFSAGQTMFGGVRNEGFDDLVLDVKLFDQNGTLYSERNQTLAGRGVWRILPGQAPFYNMPTGGWMDVSIQNGIGPISGFRYLASGPSADVLFGLPVSGDTKILPHVPPGGQWITSVTLVNPNNVPNQITLHPSRAGADSSDDLVVTLNPQEKRILEVGSQFGYYSTQPLYGSYIEISGTQPFAGYYAYQVSGGDSASMPLLTAADAHSEIVLPHYPGNSGQWWTGVAIANLDGRGPVTVAAEPVDANGNVLSADTVTMTIGLGSYRAFTIESLFGSSASQISFVRFYAQTPSDGQIGGFYLYGTKDNQMLAGANMAGVGSR